MKKGLIYVEVSGGTFYVKEKLKSFGLMWDGNRKVWKGTIDEGHFNELEKLAEKNSLELSKRSLTPPAYDEDEDRWDGRNRNRGYVRCWECGRLVPPGEAEWDGSGWYCGC